MTCSTQIGLGDLLERRPERRHQRVRQPVDESDRVRHEQLAPVRQSDLADERIERDEQRIRRFGIRPRQLVEQRRLARVGVADERNGRHRRLVTALAQLRASPAHVLDVLRDGVNACADPTAIGLELRFTGTSRADAATQTRQRVAGADEPRQEILQLCEFDLQLAFARARAAREDVENQLGAVDDLPVDRLFDVAELRRASARCRRSRGRRQSRRTMPRASSILPAPRKVDGSGFGRSCSTRSTTSAPAACGEARRARRASARRRADAFGPAIKPTSAARSGRTTPWCRQHMPEPRPRESRRHGPAPAARRSRPRSWTARHPASCPVSSRRSTTRPSVRSTSSGSAVGRLAAVTFALVAVMGVPTAAADRARDVIGRHAHADTAGPRADVRAQAPRATAAAA